jgi:RimJ/RimL family protein N-acetyltransferase
MVHPLTQDYRLDNLRLSDFLGIYRIAANSAFYYAFLNQNQQPPWRGTLRFMWLCCWTRWRRPRHWFKAIRLTRTNQLLGCVLILDLHVVAPGLAEIAYFIDAPMQGRGITTAAVVAVVRWAAQRHGLRRLQANADPENLASLAILRKLGMATRHHIPPDFSAFFDRAGQPRPQMIAAVSEFDLAKAMTQYPPEHDLIVT